MSTTSSRPEDQPNQRRAARNVSLASFSPDSTRMRAPVRSWIRASTSSPLPASRTAEVAKAMKSSTPLSSAIRSASATTSVSRSSPTCDSVLSALQVGGERQLDLVREGGQRTRAGIGIDDQHVHGVRADVEYPQSHDSTVPSIADRTRLLDNITAHPLTYPVVHGGT